MLVNFSGIKINVELFGEEDKSNSPFLVFLHGFTGSSYDWEQVIHSINTELPAAAIDLLGHGKSDSPEDVNFYTTESLIKQICEVINHITKNKVILIGYSMGGRAALSFTLKYPEIVESLILESASAGIKDDNLREERVKKDEELAVYIETHSIEEFVDHWMNLEIFNTQRRFSNKKREEIRELKLKNNKTGLANSLRGFSTGKMPPLYNKLNNIKTKTLLITGELDTKFTEINSEMVKLLQNTEHKIIKSAGHNTHLEEQKSFLEAVNNFLLNYS
jgi:2-succinyl-6-hydroxy-2,4-cyclohexadiene-1-carboxylate synthase